ncbi:MAG: VWA domain-containing protein, partial [Acidobacteriaceae bacterium]|nr:VWA domain-containing protein [Acidobacteriaceae bacterium]
MKTSHSILAAIIILGLGFGLWARVQEGDTSTFHVKVDLVVLGVSVTDTKGKYVNGLKPKDFKVYEDEIPQKLSTFAEGNGAPLQVLENGETRPLRKNGETTNQGNGPVDPHAINLRTDATGTNVFVLFDTSNYMYRGFVYASDSIADFIRGLDRADSVAVYTYSRNLNRAVMLNRDRGLAIAGLRKAVAGDDSALYNCLLLTLRDAAKVPGRKVVIVFSNGPDNASMVAPDDVRAVAEDEGIPIYVISTSELNKDPISSSIFKRISTNTGGKTYFAKTWQKQVEAFEAIREDLGN